MTVVETISDAFTNLLANPLRTFLTMLGVIIGVAAVISMISIVEGGQQKLTRSLERLGTNLLFIWQKTLSKEDRRHYSGRSVGMRYSDALAIRESRPDVTVVPIQLLNDQTVKARNRHRNLQVTATTPEFQIARNFYPAQGRFLTQEDLDAWHRVVVLGKDLVPELFDSTSPLGQELKIGEYRYTVVGVMEEKGARHNTNYDEKIFIPITSAFRWFTGNDRIGFMILHVPSRPEMKAVTNQVRSLLIQRHDGVEDISIVSQGDFLQAMDQALWTFRIVLGGVALVALLVGGIGIMNIMLVTVTERTHEIGLRKAIGATRKDILTLFLVEAITISLIGGLMGIVSGVALGHGFGHLVAQAMPGEANWGAVILPSAIATAFAFAITIGIAFGLYPAIKASTLDPAEALRYQ